MFDAVRMMTLKTEGISAVSQGFAIVNALVLAKVALILEAVHKKRTVRESRLVFRVLSHSLLLTVTLIAFSLLEEGIKALIHHQALGANLDASHVSYILVKCAVFFILLIPFCAFQELARLLGSRQLTDLFLKPVSDDPYLLVRESETHTAVTTD